MWWCDACNTTHPASGGWYALWLTASGACGIQPNIAPNDATRAYREEVYACGQGSALVLVERYLHTGSFAKPRDLPPLPSPVTTTTAVENL